MWGHIVCVPRTTLHRLLRLILIRTVIILWAQDTADNAGLVNAQPPTLTVVSLAVTYQAAEKALFQEFMAIAANAKIVIGGMVPEWVAANDHTGCGAIKRALSRPQRHEECRLCAGPVGFAGSKTLPCPGLIHYINLAKPGVDIAGRMLAWLCSCPSTGVRVVTADVADQSKTYQSSIMDRCSKRRR